MIDFINSHNTLEDAVTSLSQTITFEYARTNPGVQVMERLRSTGILKPIKVVEPFTGFKAQTIGDVNRIHTGPENTGITIKNVVVYIEEPCIPAFLMLQNLGIQTVWSSANNQDRFALISIKMETLSEENKNIAISNNLCKYCDLDLTFPIESTNTVQEVSNKFLALCSVFVSQPVLYGHQSQTEYLNEYSKYSTSYIAEISNIDANYLSDHLNYLLTTFPQYITFNEGRYSCNNMPDELFQKEILDRKLYCKIFYSEPQVCINGIVWSSRELYDINVRNTNQKSDKSSSDQKDFSIQQQVYASNDLDIIDEVKKHM